MDLEDIFAKKNGNDDPMYQFYCVVFSSVVFFFLNIAFSSLAHMLV